MHSVCPQIRLPAFNRLDASSCLAPFDKQLELFPASVSDSFPPPFAVSSFFLPFFGGRVVAGKKKKQQKKSGGNGFREWCEEGLEKGGQDSFFCGLRSAVFRCQLCASRTKSCLRSLAHRWFVTSVTDTRGRSRDKHPRMNNKFHSMRIFLYMNISH